MILVERVDVCNWRVVVRATALTAFNSNWNKQCRRLRH